MVTMTDSLGVILTTNIDSSTFVRDNTSATAFEHSGNTYAVEVGLLGDNEIKSENFEIEVEALLESKL